MKDYIPLIETGLWISFAIGALMVFRKPVKKQIEAGAHVKFGMFELQGIAQRVNSVERQVNALSESVSELFLFTMSGPMYINLEKLASGDFGSYEMGKALERELYHLRDIGYIEVNSIRSIPPRGDNLSQYVRVTRTGRRFVELRESLRKPSD